MYKRQNIERLTLTLRFPQSCGCDGVTSATLNISDTQAPTLFVTPITACADQPFSLAPNITRGTPPFNFRWSDNSTNRNLQTSIQAPTNFGVTVTDFCNNQTIDSVQVNLQEIPFATLSGDIEYCEGLNDLILPINFNGNPPWSFTYQIDGNAPIRIDSIFDNNFSLPISQSGNYQLIEFSDAACSGEASGVGQVNDINIEVAVEAISPSCPNREDGQINLDIIAANTPYDINWSSIVNDLINPSNLSVGVYELMIRDANNCVWMDSIFIENPIRFDPECTNNIVYVPNAFSPNGDGANDFFEIFLDNQSTIQQILKVEIIDRWGNLVYQSEGTLPKWDGRFRDRLLDPAVFLYNIQLELNDGKTELLQGTLNLVR